MEDSTEQELERLRYPTGRFQPRGTVTDAERDELIGAIEALPAQIRAAVAELPAAALETPYRPGGWTGRQVVHHVADSHLNAYVRFRLALTEDEPVIKPYDEAAWAELVDAATADVSLSLGMLDGMHGRWVRLLRAMKTADFERAVMHPESGRVTLGQLLQLYAWHGRHHLGHLRSIRAAGGGDAG